MGKLVLTDNTDAGVVVLKSNLLSYKLSYQSAGIKVLYFTSNRDLKTTIRASVCETRAHDLEHPHFTLNSVAVSLLPKQKHKQMLDCIAPIQHSQSQHCVKTEFP